MDWHGVIDIDQWKAMAVIYRVGQINPHKFQMVGNTYTKRNSNISFMHVIVYIHSS